jgi:hypothetical protein
MVAIGNALGASRECLLLTSIATLPGLANGDAAFLLPLPLGRADNGLH